MLTARCPAFCAHPRLLSHSLSFCLSSVCLSSAPSLPVHSTREHVYARTHIVLARCCKTHTYYFAHFFFGFVLISHYDKKHMTKTLLSCPFSSVQFHGVSTCACCCKFSRTSSPREAETVHSLDKFVFSSQPLVTATPLPSSTNATAVGVSCSGIT